MAKINVIEKTPGKHLEYRVSGEKIIFGDDDLSVKLSTRERDEETVLVITADKDQGLMMGTGGNAHNYAAQIVIPARRYEEQEKEMEIGRDEDGGPVMGMGTVRVPQPFDVSRCTLYLWGMEE